MDAQPSCTVSPSGESIENLKFGLVSQTSVALVGERCSAEIVTQDGPLTRCEPGDRGIDWVASERECRLALASSSHVRLSR